MIVLKAKAAFRKMFIILVFFNILQKLYNGIASEKRNPLPCLHYTSFLTMFFLNVSLSLCVDKAKRDYIWHIIILLQILILLRFGLYFSTWIKKILRFKEGKAISAFYFSCFPQINILFIVLLYKL